MNSELRRGRPQHIDDPLVLDTTDRMRVASSASPRARERIEGGTIHGYLNRYRAQRAGAFRNDLPPHYRLDLVSRDDNGNAQMGNAVIDRMGLSAHGAIVTLELRESDTKYDYPSDVPSQEPHVHERTLELPLCTLRFRYREHQVSTRKTFGDHFEWNHMRVVDAATLDRFYEQLMRSLNAGRR